MEPTKGDQSGQSKLRVIGVCDDCGQEYNATVEAMLKSFGARTERSLCRNCREKALQTQAQNDELRHAQSLAFFRQEAIGKARIPPKFWGYTFQNFDVADNEQGVAHLINWMERFPIEAPPKGYPSIILASQNNGVGKTHLACAVIASLIGRFTQLGRERMPFQFWTTSDIRHRLQDAQRFGGKENTEEAFKDFASMWLLVLDDIGKERLTGADAAAVYEVYYTIINDRYNSGLPMLITSNLGMEPWEHGGMSLKDLVGLAGVDRLKEMTGGLQVVLKGASRR